MKNLFIYISVILLLLCNYFYAQTDKNKKDNEGVVCQVKDFYSEQFLKEFIQIDPFTSKLPVVIRTQNLIE